MAKYLSSEGLEKFKKELEYLEKVKRKEVVERIRRAAEQGDLKENAGYDAAKEEQGFVEGRIKQLKEIISQARVVEKKESDRIQIGSLVYLSGDGQKEKFEIVSPEEVDILNNKISFKSPLGEQLMGKKKGESVRIDAFDGKKEYKIIKVE